MLLLPATQMRGMYRLEESEDGLLPKEFSAWINLNGESRKKKPEWQPVECTISNRQFSCDIPSQLLDMKFSTPGNMPVYRWGVAADEAPLDVGEIRMLRGGSLSGWVIAEGGKPDSPIELTLFPRSMGTQNDTRELRRRELKALRAVANEDGFFTLGPIPAGGFDLEATKAGLAPQRIEDLDLTVPKEIVLDDVIELVASPDLDVYLNPPVNPEQQPWQVVLMRPRSNSNTLKTIDRSAAGFDGHWHLDAVPSGHYRLEVRDFRDATWLVRDLELDQLREPLIYELDSVAIEGTLTSGGKPLDGTVIFGTRQGRPNVALEATEGDFKGLLPREGLWKVEVELAGTRQYSVGVDPVTVEAGAGGTAATVAIELPDTLLEGEVQQQGEPVAAAFVLVTTEGESEASRPRVARVRTDDNGKFSIHGLKPVPVQVAAYLGAFDPASDWVDVDIREGVEAPYLELELVERVEYQARVMSPRGPVAGAQIFIEAVTPSSMSWPAQAISGSDGVARFRLPFDSHGKQAHFMVLAAGYGFTMHQQSLLKGSGIVLSISPDKGDIHLPYPLGTLHFKNASLPVSKVLTKLISANRFFVQPGDGVIFKGMAAGEYTQCPANGKVQDCVSGVLAPSSFLKLEVVDSDFLEDDQ